jgi:hypothetical protein
MGEQDRIKVPQEVYEKVTDAKDDDLADWLRANGDAMLPAEYVDIRIVNQVIEQGYANDLTDDEIEQLNEDPFLIAYALLDLFLPERHKWTLPFAAISGNAYRLTRNPLSLVAGSLVSI